MKKRTYALALTVTVVDVDVLLSIQKYVCLVNEFASIALSFLISIFYRLFNEINIRLSVSFFFVFTSVVKIYRTLTELICPQRLI